jgi:alkylhydroperoxidase/carboxymuconolactone decarboxylase family protein
MNPYYDSADLARFGQIGQLGKPLADEFFKYYGMVTGSDGALTKREKALIALALSHAEKCPYCIDAYSTACLEAGASAEQMMEAVHVAAVMKAGVTLVHSVQMMNHVDKLTT